MGEEQILKSLTDTLEIEGSTIIGLKSAINDKFVGAVIEMYQCTGKIVITGIGKSALIGMKIAATLNSTGSRAVFMHATDAVHGDIGILNKEDLVMCLSKSGDTTELKVLIPIIKSMGNKIVSLVSNANSFLAHQSDYCLYLPIATEADPNNLAPTASTTAQLAVGDALAVALLNMRGFTSDHFALLHPGGNLGKLLFTRVKDICFRNNKPKVYLKDNLKEIILAITTGRLGATAVVDEEEHLVGIITDGDLRRMLQQHNFDGQRLASDIMTTKPKTIGLNALAVEAMQQMQTMSITQLLVTEDKKYKGIIHIHDLIREGII